MSAQKLDAARLPVACGSCPWQSRRLPGNVVWCPKCGSLAAFQAEGKE
jgi:hypothetical protein